MIIDTKLLQNRICRFISNNRRRKDFILLPTACDLIDRLNSINRKFDSILLQGEHADVLADKLLADKLLEQGSVRVLGKNTKITLQSPVSSGFSNKDIFRVVGENERMCFRKSSFDAVISFLSLQHINDMGSYLSSIKDILSEDGVFLACFIGGESLQTLRQCFMDTELSFYDKVSLRVLPFTDIRSMGNLLRRFDFRMIVTDVDRLVYSYSSFRDIFLDIRSIGWSNNICERSRQILGKFFFASLEANYRGYKDSMAGNDFLVVYDVLWLICWSAGKNQPKALKPGSARISLADVIGKDKKYEI